MNITASRHEFVQLFQAYQMDYLIQEAAYCWTLFQKLLILLANNEVERTLKEPPASNCPELSEMKLEGTQSFLIVPPPL